MGRLIYGNLATPFDMDDRVLAHLRIVAMTKLRRGEPFMLDLHLGDDLGQCSLWFHPGVQLQFHFHGSRPARINTAWIEELLHDAGTPAGLSIGLEPRESRAGASEPETA